MMRTGIGRNILTIDGAMDRINSSNFAYAWGRRIAGGFIGNSAVLQ
jgi:hypothetical protein